MIRGSASVAGTPGEVVYRENRNNRHWIDAIVLLVCGALLLHAAAARAEAQSCLGDCDANLAVTVDELVKGVNIALGTMELGQCGAFDRDQSGTVSVDELVAAVRGALEGCTPAGSQVQMTIRGIVSGATGSEADVMPLADAKVRGTVDRNSDGETQENEEVSTTSGDDGAFVLRVMAAPGESVVVGFQADGFAPLFRTFSAEDDSDLLLNVALRSTETLTCSGPRCSLQGDKLSIEGLPDDVTGTARVFNPVTETDAFPGGFSDREGNLLVSGVFAAVDLEDSGGNPVNELASDAVLRMQIPRDTWSIIRDIQPGNGRIDVPLYAFDEVLGTWVREGEAVLEDGNGTLLPESALAQIHSGTLSGVIVARSTVRHFSYWNVDWPVESHACVSGTVTDAGGNPAGGATVLVRGVTYTGAADPAAVGPDGRFCVEVMRSEGSGEDVDQDGVSGETQRIRVRVSFKGKLYDLGDFDAPQAQGTCGGGGCTDIGALRLTPERELSAALCTITGTVRGIDGKPVQGAIVIAVDDAVPEEVSGSLCEQTELGFCDLLGWTDADGFFRLTTVVFDSLFYGSFTTIDEGDSSLFLSTQGTVQGCPSAPLNITLSDGIRIVETSVEVSGNTITWTPSRFEAAMLDVSSEQDTKWMIYSEAGGFSSPVAYGVLPAGTAQIMPYDGASPPPLASGDRVDIYVSGVGEDGFPYWGYGSGMVP